MSKFIVINDENNLFCKNCNTQQLINYTNLNQFTATMTQFMSDHKDCAQADELITLQQIAKLAGVPYSSLRSYGKKLKLPQPILKGCRKYYNKKQVTNYLKNNDIKNNLAKIRNEYYLTNIKVNIIPNNKSRIDKKPLPLINRFIRGEWDTDHRQAETRAKIETARINRPTRLVLTCIQTNDGDLVRRFE